jgi:endonuclease-3
MKRKTADAPFVPGAAGKKSGLKQSPKRRHDNDPAGFHGNPENKKIPWARIIELINTSLSGRTIPSVSQVAYENSDPYRVLVSTIISLRTKDEVTVKASGRLLDRAASPGILASLGEEEIGALIYPAGFYRTKAKNLKTIARILIEQYDGRVPSDEGELLALPGVGRKTANLVRNLGFGIPAICVDTHVHRVSNRLGWVSTKDPAGTEAALMLILPKQYWIPINELLVRFGQNICTPTSPWCSRCPIYRYCDRVGVGRSR